MFPYLVGEETERANTEPAKEASGLLGCFNQSGQQVKGGSSLTLLPC